MKRISKLKLAGFVLGGLGILLAAALALDAALVFLLDIPNPYNAHDNLACYLASGQLAFFHHPYYWELVPENRTVSKKGTVYETNGLGFRGDEAGSDPPPDSRRVVMMGDSSIFGFDVPLNDTLPALLETQLNNDDGGSTIEVINAGVPGYTTTQGLIQLRDTIFELEPDLVLVSFGWNDARSSTHNLERLQGATGSGFACYRLWRALHERSWLVRRLSSYWLRPGPKDMVLGNPDELMSAKDTADTAAGAADDALRLDLYRSNLERMIRLLQDQGIAVAFTPVSVPPAFLAVMREVGQAEGTELLTTEQTLFTAWNRGHPKPPGAALHPADRFREMRKDRTLFVDMCHPSAAGMRMISRHLAPDIERLLAAAGA